METISLFNVNKPPMDPTAEMHKSHVPGHPGG